MKDETFEHVSIVVPTYKEVESLRLLVKRITDVISRLPVRYDIVIVDDNSRVKVFRRLVLGFASTLVLTMWLGLGGCGR